MGYPRSIGAVTGQLGGFTKRRPKLGAALIILPIFGVLVACAPADQEECRAEAAAKAPTKAGLDELLDLCEQQFPATRKLGGGYEYNGVPVAGLVPTAAEIRAIQEAPEGCMTEECALPEATEGAMTEAEAFTDAHTLNGSAGTEGADSRTGGIPLNS
jgi:hypothetical protein